MIAGLALLLLTWVGAGIPFGVVLTTLYGGDVDIRAAGSGNIGATNVARLYGWRIAGPVLALDMAKGLVPVLFARLAWPEAGVLWLGVVGLVAFLGHCSSVFLELRGGKGVATGAGALLGIVPVPTFAAILTWAGVLALTGRSSVAALVSSASLVLVVALFQPPALPVVALFALGIAFTHRSNIRRIVRGEESTILQPLHPKLRPVRWKRAEEPGAADVLAQSPAGTGTGAPLWKEPSSAEQRPRPE